MQEMDDSLFSVQQKARLHWRQGRSIGVRNDPAASEKIHWRQGRSSGVRENPAASRTTLAASKTVPAATRTTPVAPETTTVASGRAIGIRKDPAASGKIQRRQERSKLGQLKRRQDNFGGVDSSSISIFSSTSLATSISTATQDLRQFKTSKAQAKLDPVFYSIHK